VSEVKPGRTLKQVIVDLIRQDGPMTVERYMALCLGHPTLGCYTTRDPFGEAGDFTTAPEISQMFGELIGLWAAQVWLDQGHARPLALVEIGPGRGTLMADALRAIQRAAPPLLAGATVELIETSLVLRERQRHALAATGVALRWHDSIRPALDGPAIILANELLDALPVRQFVRMGNPQHQGWRERLVGADADGGLRFGLSAPLPAAMDPQAGAGHAPGTIIERSPASDRLVTDVAGHVARAGGAALFIDYGSDRSGSGDTLQAVSRHRFVDPLASPGEADLTVQVDFARVAGLAAQAGAAVHGPVRQGALLRALGLEARAQSLKARATPEQAGAIDAAVARLTETGERGMGDLFKAIAFTRADAPPIPGFA
jgi:SAM-dependent MidA family methyltransferase